MSLSDLRVSVVCSGKNASTLLKKNNQQHLPSVLVLTLCTPTYKNQKENTTQTCAKVHVSVRNCIGFVGV